MIDNRTYFRRGGQVGVETRRGCPRKCIYCADPLAKGAATRLRNPAEVADEFESLAGQGIDVVHLCDAEFNIPADQARAVCDEFVRRGLGERVRWYAYLAVVPFDADLARSMRRAGCVGINFTGDSASPAMLRTYRQPHGREDLAEAVRLCRAEGIAVMIDLLLGGPGETPDSLRETIDFVRQIGPDCAGAALGVRLYPGTAMAEVVAAEGPLATNPAIHRRYPGPIDFLRPTFYVSTALGPRPARGVRELVAGDPRFFAPVDPEPTVESTAGPSTDHNYNDNQALVDAIAAGARGAYWDILRKMRQ
jgi:tryptophan 2-C-methyltransferase